MSSDTYVSPLRRNRRAVIDEHGRVHPSITEAAIARGLSVSHTWTKARLQRGGWRFLDEAPRQPADPSATSEG